MNGSRTLGCDEVAALLALREAQSRCDRQALAAHLRACAACASEAAEIEAFLTTLASPAFDAPPPVTVPPRASASRGSWGLRVAAAALLVVAVGAAALLICRSRESDPDRRSESAGAPLPQVAPELAGAARTSPTAVSAPLGTSITSAVVHYDRGRTTTSRVTEGTWSPRPPRLAALPERPR